MTVQTRGRGSMRGVSLWFVATGSVFVTLGMLGGIAMAVSSDHTLAPAHAHLNLVGWVTMALFGIYYHLVPAAADTRLARVHYTIATAGVLAMVPGIILAVLQRNDVLVAVGSLLTLGSMLIFVFTVFRHRV
ncbi:MAG: cbb3-type cytochrome c oxidase subunit I [Phaeovulum sp.]|nr:cbb3-type cytochrome c oxidase subunit I [Phaeovulum sp.]MDP3859968.1 cbb3-type cytochrome c oxidase subunit I [Phaeovulum sp.]